MLALLGAAIMHWGPKLYSELIAWTVNTIGMVLLLNVARVAVLTPGLGDSATRNGVAAHSSIA